ncbi:hypothetical protein LIPSTDRAFT_297459 [Lipomyces starkeyi NRRL Y-11557]|uniref:Uncharacterized protein n=1 Tax=Lipomyces starkeyi NRRL Y-11557 TaxID=675824 RepID=A0A1E3Q473_LIPST|nr:hypothetical protein LIPSTDRAFT_297459 [Lipomyces starkeyi NRRL Y-11557]
MEIDIYYVRIYTYYLDIYICLAYLLHSGFSLHAYYTCDTINSSRTQNTSSLQRAQRNMTVRCQYLIEPSRPYARCTNSGPWILFTGFYVSCTRYCSRVKQWSSCCRLHVICRCSLQKAGRT